MTCRCGARTGLTHCAFCRRTIALIRSESCVTCTRPVIPEYEERVEGQCRTCRDRGVRPCAATRRLLRQAAAARSKQKRRAA